MKRPLFLSVLSAALGLASALPALSWIAYFAFVPLLLLIEETPFRQSILWGSFTAFLYFAVLAWPIHLFDWRAYLGGLILPSLVFMLPVGALHFLWHRLKKQPTLRLVLPACLFAALNVCVKRFQLGLAPSLPVAGQPLIVLQLLSLSGSSAVLFFVLLINGLVWEFLKQGKKLSRITLLGCIGLFMAVAIYGKARLLQPLETPSVPVALVQHNLPIDLEWRKQHVMMVLNRYVNLAHKAAEENADLIIFPQYGVVTDIYGERSTIAQTALMTEKWILLGTYIPARADTELEQGQYNAALLFPPDGRPMGVYRAMLPPPFRNIGQRLGKNEQPLSTPWGKIGILLCFEDTSSPMARYWVKQGAGILVALSNVGHFKKSWVARFHFLLDRMRAIETARYLIRCSANGFSGVIDPFGRIVVKSKLDEEKILHAKVAWREGKTLYARCGDWLGIACLIFVVYWAGFLTFGRRLMRKTRKIRALKKRKPISA